MALQAEDDRDVLVFHDILAEPADLSSAREDRSVATIPTSNNVLNPSQPPRPSGPSEDSPLKSSDQIGPKRPSVECCGFGIGAVILVTSSIVLAVALTLGLVLSIRFGPSQIPPSGAVSSPAKVCSDIGLRLLKDKGASAADAAIAMALCVGVVRAESSGLGGDGFAIYHDHRRSSEEVFVGRSCSPSNVDALKDLKDFSDYRLSGWAVATPNELSLLYHLYLKLGGKIPWAEVVQPASDLAKHGFGLTEETVKILSSSLVNLADFKANMPEELVSQYLDGTNVKPVGSIVKRKDLGAFLDKMAKLSADDAFKSFYQSNDKIFAAIKKRLPKGQTKALLTVADLKRKCVLNITNEPPLKSSFKDFTLMFPGLPSSAVAVAEILGIFATGNFTKKHLVDDDAYMHHHIAEAAKHAFVHLYQMDNITEMTEETQWKAISDQIKDSGTFGTWQQYSLLSASAQVNPLPLAETTGNFLAAIDRNEKFVALTLSLGSPFGSMLMTTDGVILNNHMEAFYYNNPNHRNAIGPNKRPWSVQAPIVAHVPQSCKIRTAVGAMPFVPFLMPPNNTATVPSAWHVIPNLAEVVARLVGAGQESASHSLKRWRYSPLPLMESPEYVIAEGNSTANAEFDGASASLLNTLKSMGQDVSETKQPMSLVGSVAKESDHLYDRVDPRSSNWTAIHYGPT